MSDRKSAGAKALPQPLRLIYRCDLAQAVNACMRGAARLVEAQESE